MNRWLTGLAVACAVAVGGCGVAAEDQPREIDPPRGPFPAFGSPAPSSPETGAAAEPLYFVRAGKLVAVIRRVRVAPTLPQHVQHLLAGPTDAERGAGLTGTLNGSIVVSGVTLSAGQVTVDVGDDPDESVRSDEVLAFAQIVCTLTARPDVTSVVFRHDGRPLGVPRADGSLSTAGLTAADYTALTAPA
jgi:hypothetical protein